MIYINRSTFIKYASLSNLSNTHLWWGEWSSRGLSRYTKSLSQGLAWGTDFQAIAKWHVVARQILKNILEDRKKRLAPNVNTHPGEILKQELQRKVSKSSTAFSSLYHQFN